MLNKEEIKKIIPHRDPFLLVDEIIELRVGDGAIGVKYVNLDEYYFKGHFPGNPVMPGVLILETMAQVGAVAILSMDEYKDKIAYFLTADNVKFRQMVKPGDKLVLDSRMTSFRRGIGFAESKAYVDDVLVCEAKIGFAVR